MKNDIALRDKPKLSLQDFKSLYYYLNAKPDTELKLFKESRRIEASDLIRLNDDINEKLSNHKIAGSFATINISFSDKRVLDISSWKEFLDTKWNSPARIKHIEIQWDFNIVLPRYELPQRHTLKIRFGSSIKPNELFQIMINSDSDIKAEEARAKVICKVDYINSVISTELINLVSDWYESLPSLSEQKKLINFLTDHDFDISLLIDLFFDLGGILIGLGILRLIIFYNFYTPSKNIFLDIGIVLSILWASVYIFGYLGHLLGSHTRKNLRNLESASMFNITRGDINENQTKSKENNNIIKKIFRDVFSSIIADFILLILHLIIKL